ncbi:MAG TPA: hypothetical protein VFK09_04465 [Gemmatimonadales bacterium]|nr:hypothetical protein [Gemmatimonadales bacterium]
MGDRLLLIGAVGLALVSAGLIMYAAREWCTRPPRAAPADPRSPRRGALMLTGVSVLFLVTLLVVAREFGWGRDRVLWLGLGLFLAAMTLARPWWFWDDYRARWLRQAIGDELTTLFYLIVAAAMMWVALYTTWTFGRR